MALLFVMTLFYRDMVPAVYYLVTLLTAVMLYRYTVRASHRSPSMTRC